MCDKDQANSSGRAIDILLSEVSEKLREGINSDKLGDTE
jgi:hypothetical protein